MSEKDEKDTKDKPDTLIRRLRARLERLRERTTPETDYRVAGGEG